MWYGREPGPSVLLPGANATLNDDLATGRNVLMGTNVRDDCFGMFAA